MEIAEVIGIASTQANYVAILTPLMEQRLIGKTRNGLCLDPNLPTGYAGHPRQ
jgi:hypothetical protein